MNGCPLLTQMWLRQTPSDAREESDAVKVETQSSPSSSDQSCFSWLLLLRTQESPAQSQRGANTLQIIIAKSDVR